LPEPVKGTILAPKPRESGECRFKRLLAPILEAVGPYPHAELHAMTNGRKKQVARLIKCECADAVMSLASPGSGSMTKARRIARRTAK
jgi:hypothetical protein